MANWTHKHILALSNFSIEDYKSVFDLTEDLILNNAGTKDTGFKRKLITSIFFKLVQEQKE